MLAGYREELPGVSRGRYLALTSERLAKRGNVERAIVLFQEAEAVISNEAVAIASESTQKAYLQSASEPLKRVAELANIAAPPFDGCTIADTEPFRRRVFATTSLALSIPAFLAGATLTCLTGFGGMPRDSGVIAILALFTVLGAMLGLLAGLLSILRSESDRWRILKITLCLAFLAICVVGFGLAEK